MSDRRKFYKDFGTEKLIQGIDIEQGCKGDEYGNLDKPYEVIYRDEYHEAIDLLLTLIERLHTELQETRAEVARLKELRALLSAQPEKPAFDFSKILGWRRTLHGGNGDCEYTIRIDRETRDENFGEFLRALTEKPAAGPLNDRSVTGGEVEKQPSPLDALKPAEWSVNICNKTGQAVFTFLVPRHEEVTAIELELERPPCSRVFSPPPVISHTTPAYMVSRLKKLEEDNKLLTEQNKRLRADIRGIVNR